jgi:hypothetical protein
MLFARPGYTPTTKTGGTNRTRAYALLCILALCELSQKADDATNITVGIRSVSRAEPTFECPGGSADEWLEIADWAKSPMAA